MRVGQPVQLRVFEVGEDLALEWSGGEVLSLKEAREVRARLEKYVAPKRHDESWIDLGFQRRTSAGHVVNVARASRDNGHVPGLVLGVRRSLGQKTRTRESPHEQGMH